MRLEFAKTMLTKKAEDRLLSAQKPDRQTTVKAKKKPDEMILMNRGKKMESIEKKREVMKRSPPKKPTSRKQTASPEIKQKPKPKAPFELPFEMKEP